MTQKRLPRYQKDRITSKQFTSQVTVLSDIPAEVLIIIVGMSEWDDVLRIRKTNQLLNKISSCREVWLAIYLRYMGIRIARPYFLPKPLNQCSASELEKAVVNWEASWPNIIQTKRRIHEISGGSSGERPVPIHGHIVLVPGGRWVLAGLKNGSVSYLDLNSPLGTVALQLLIASPRGPQPARKDWPSQFRVTYDFASEQEESPQDHDMKAFRVAVATYYSPTL
ncbi:hypothetical protein DFP72DRAFT_1092888 [Ephemerocybe angulata]|uniref:F-box domain-containing protein n=1 Tax=Ephemerocybe angulata TaxID=980116 RepID=A0A8H6HEV6_9AGAR|nr:hypothetical protein DFP72DRAFT_1092888 [Tulosesus angulatus]